MRIILPNLPGETNPVEITTYTNPDMAQVIDQDIL